MGTGPKGGAGSSRIGGCVRYRCDIRSARRRTEALAGCTKIIGEGVRGVIEGDKLNASFSHDRRGSIIEGFREGGGGEVVRCLGESLTAPHMDPEHVQAFFEDLHQFPGIYNLRHIARVGVSVDVRPDGDLTKELTYGNRSSAQKFHVAAWEKEVAGVASGRAIVFPKEQAGKVEGWRVSPVRVVEEREKLRIIYDMTFEHRDGSGGGSVNSTTDWDVISKCALAGEMHDMVQRALELRGNGRWQPFRRRDAVDKLRSL